MSSSVRHAIWREAAKNVPRLYPRSKIMPAQVGGLLCSHLRSRVSIGLDRLVVQRLTGLSGRICWWGSMLGKQGLVRRMGIRPPGLYVCVRTVKALQTETQSCLHLNRLFLGPNFAFSVLHRLPEANVMTSALVLLQLSCLRHLHLVLGV